MIALLRHLLLFAALLPIAGSAHESAEAQRHEHGASTDRRDERQEYERYQANYQGLKALIAEATKLQTTFLEGGDLAAFQKDGAAWEARAGKFLRKNLAPLYADEFARIKYLGPDIPADKELKIRVAYQRIEAKKAALRAYTTELRKPD